MWQILMRTPNILQRNIDVHFIPMELHMGNTWELVIDYVLVLFSLKTKLDHVKDITSILLTNKLLGHHQAAIIIDEFLHLGIW